MGKALTVLIRIDPENGDATSEAFDLSAVSELRIAWVKLLQDGLYEQSFPTGSEVGILDAGRLVRSNLPSTSDLAVLRDYSPKTGISPSFWLGSGLKIAGQGPTLG